MVVTVSPVLVRILADMVDAAMRLDRGPASVYPTRSEPPHELAGQPLKTASGEKR